MMSIVVVALSQWCFWQFWEQFSAPFCRLLSVQAAFSCAFFAVSFLHGIFFCISQLHAYSSALLVLIKSWRKHMWKQLTLCLPTPLYLSYAFVYAHVCAHVGSLALQVCLDSCSEPCLSLSLAVVRWIKVFQLVGLVLSLNQYFLLNGCLKHAPFLLLLVDICLSLIHSSQTTDHIMLCSLPSSHC